MKIGIKVKFGKQCRRFRITEKMKLADFNGRLEALFSAKLYNTVTRYQDDDKDWVNIDTEEEFSEAKLLILKTNEKILKLEITVCSLPNNLHRRGGENQTDLEKFILQAIEQSGGLLETEKLKTIYNNVKTEIKEGKAQEHLTNFVKEIGLLFTELSLNSNTTEIQNEMKQEFTVDMNKGNGSIQNSTSSNNTGSSSNGSSSNNGSSSGSSSSNGQSKVVKPKILGATLISDSGVQSDTEIEQESVFQKKWMVKNTGDCDWKVGSHLKFIGGDEGLNIQNDSKFKLSELAKKGQTVEITVELSAPKAHGSYSAYFSLVSDDGKLFGPKLLLELLVVENKAMQKWGEKLKFLSEMGFSDAKSLIVLLEKNNGDLPTTIQDFLANN